MHTLDKGTIVWRAIAVVALLLLSERTWALDNVTLITDFGYNGRHAYFFVAIEKGYYRDADLDVKVVRGQGSVDAIRQVGANNAIVGFADAGSLVLARGNDQIPVKLVSIVYAKPPQAVFCREDSGIKQPKDLEGASIANPAGGATVDMFPVYAKAAGLDASKVKWIVAGSDLLPGLLAGNRVPCVGQFTVGEPLLRMQAAPTKLVRFAFADAGVSFYGNGLIATDSTIATKADIVRRLVAATIRGMKDAFARPDEAGTNIIQRSMSQLPREKPKQWLNWRKSTAENSASSILPASKRLLTSSTASSSSRRRWR